MIMMIMMIMMVVMMMVRMMLVFASLSEQEALCCTLPGSDRDGRGNSECIRSRRQVLQLFFTFFLFPSFFFCSYSFRYFSFPMICILSASNSSNRRHSSVLSLQSCRCSDGRDPPAARHRQLCSDGALGCTAVPGITAPHRPYAHL